ncbi:MAG: hypothetical protein JNK85_22510 [Verrucomicrobiales bacterium]|nr:hypothetical protein [Verrucomicrobiales bacterium]
MKTHGTGRPAELAAPGSREIKPPAVRSSKPSCWLWPFLSVLLVGLLSPGTLLAARLVEVQRSYDPAWNPRNDHELRRSGFSVDALGGVALFSTLVDDARQAVEVRDLDFDRGEGKLRVQVTNAQGLNATVMFRVPETTLGLLASWVINEGTGLYTAYEVSPADAKAAGLRPSRFGGYIAAEFARTELEAVAYALDFPVDVRRVPTSQAFLNGASLFGDSASNGSAMGLAPQLVGRDWIVADYGSPFGIETATGIPKVTGSLYKLYRASRPGMQGVVIYKIEKLAAGGPRSRQLADQFPGLRVPRLRTFDLQNELFPRSGFEGTDPTIEDPSDKQRRLLQYKGVELARVVCVLRTAYRGDAGVWQKFKTELFE